MLLISVEGSSPGIETQTLARELNRCFGTRTEEPKTISFFLTDDETALAREGRYLIITTGLSAEDIFWTASRVCRWELGLETPLVFH